MSEFYYGQVIEYIDGTRDLYFEEAGRWADANSAHFIEYESFERDVTVEETYEEEVIHEAIYDDEGNLVQEEWIELVEKTREVVKQELVRPFKIVEMALEEKQEVVRELRADAYANEVDPLMNEYTRKKTFNLFEEGEEEALLAEIEAKVAEIKANNPYPVDTVNDTVNVTEEPSEVLELYSMEI